MLFQDKIIQSCFLNFKIGVVVLSYEVVKTYQL